MRRLCIAVLASVVLPSCAAHDDDAAPATSAVSASPIPVGAAADGWKPAPRTSTGDLGLRRFEEKLQREAARPPPYDGAAASVFSLLGATVGRASFKR